MLCAGVVYMATNHRRSHGTKSFDHSRRTMRLLRMSITHGLYTSKTHLNQCLQSRNRSLEDGMKNEVRFHDTHRLQATLDVGDCRAILRKHRKKGDCSQGFHQLAADLPSESSMLESAFNMSSSDGFDVLHTVGVLQSGCCSSYHPVQADEPRLQYVHEMNPTLIEIVDDILDKCAQLNSGQYQNFSQYWRAYEDTHHLSNFPSWSDGRSSQ